MSQSVGDANFTYEARERKRLRVMICGANYEPDLHNFLSFLEKQSRR